MGERVCELCGRTLEANYASSICEFCKREYEGSHRDVTANVPYPQSTTSNPQSAPHAPSVARKSPNLFAVVGLGCLALFILFIAIGFFIDNWNTSNKYTSYTSEESYIESDSASPSSATTGALASMGEYSKLQTGMSYEQVCQIIGGEGTEMSSNDIAGYKNVMYMWWGEGGNGANMNALFQNGELVQKSQFGLK